MFIEKIILWQVSMIRRCRSLTEQLLSNWISSDPPSTQIDLQWELILIQWFIRLKWYRKRSCKWEIDQVKCRLRNCTYTNILFSFSQNLFLWWSKLYADAERIADPLHTFWYHIQTSIKFHSVESKYNTVIMKANKTQTDQLPKKRSLIYTDVACVVDKINIYSLMHKATTIQPFQLHTYVKIVSSVSDFT